VEEEEGGSADGTTKEAVRTAATLLSHPPKDVEEDRRWRRRWR